jgi:hypothetical protein
VDLPRHYFRLRDPGALVFRVDGANAQGRLELEPLALVNLRTGEVKPQGGQVLTAGDEAAIAAWLTAQQAGAEARAMDDIRRTVKQLNHAAHWAQTRASDAQLDAVSQDLLLAMHDLRGVLVRRHSARLSPDNAD